MKNLRLEVKPDLKKLVRTFVKRAQLVANLNQFEALEAKTRQNLIYVISAN